MSFLFAINVPDPDSITSTDLIPGGEYAIKGDTFKRHYAAGGLVPITLLFGEKRKIFAASRVIIMGKEVCAFTKLNHLRLRGKKTGSSSAVMSDTPFVLEHTVDDIVGLVLLILASNSTDSEHMLAITSDNVSLVVPTDYTELVLSLRSWPSTLNLDDKSLAYLIDAAAKVIKARSSAERLTIYQNPRLIQEDRRKFITAQILNLVWEMNPSFKLIG